MKKSCNAELHEEFTVIMEDSDICPLCQLVPQCAAMADVLEKFIEGTNTLKGAVTSLRSIAND